MTYGHGDDIQNYPEGSIRWNMSSNVLTGLDHEGLFDYLADSLDLVTHYPDPTPRRLEDMLAKRFRIQPDEVCVTNGATEAIYLIAQNHHHQHSLILQPSFAEYADACVLHQHRISHTMQVPTGRLVDGPDLCWICNPANPSGDVIPHEQMLEQLEKNPKTLFVCDQSYEHFTREKLFTAAEAAQWPNLLLLHSMTKQFSIPGLRIGYITGATTLIDQIKRLRLPWSMGQLAQEAGLYLLRHEPDFEFDLDELLEERERVAEALTKTRVVEVWPSQSHMLLCQLRLGNAAALKDYLAREHGILIRDASNFYGLSPQYFRIAVQGREANDAFLGAFNEWIQL